MLLEEGGRWDLQIPVVSIQLQLYAGLNKFCVPLRHYSLSLLAPSTLSTLNAVAVVAAEVVKQLSFY